jgi:hypothetical protein
MKLFDEVFEREIKILNTQDELLDQEVRSLLSHAMLGDDALDVIKKETFELMVKGVCDLIWGIKIGKYKMTKSFVCRLDAQQCSEECHGNIELKDKCSFCIVRAYLTKTQTYLKD